MPRPALPLTLISLALAGTAVASCTVPQPAPPASTTDTGAVATSTAPPSAPTQAPSSASPSPVSTTISPTSSPTSGPTTSPTSGPATSPTTPPDKPVTVRNDYFSLRIPTMYERLDIPKSDKRTHVSLREMADRAGLHSALTVQSRKTEVRDLKQTVRRVRDETLQAAKDAREETGKKTQKAKPQAEFVPTKVGKVSYRKINKVPSWGMVVIGKAGSETVVRQQWYVKHDGRLYAVVMVSSPAAAKPATATLEDVFASWRWAKPRESATSDDSD